MVSLDKQGMLPLWEHGGWRTIAGICALHSRTALQEVFLPGELNCVFVCWCWFKDFAALGNNNSIFTI